MHQTKHLLSVLTLSFGALALASSGGCDDDTDDGGGDVDGGGSSGTGSSSSGGGSSSSSGGASSSSSGSAADGGATQCAQKGGTCVPVSPTNGCQVTGDPAEYACASGVGEACCLDDAPANDCEAEGGECVGVAPDACAGGSTEDGKCGDSVGVTCCKRP